MQRKQVVQALAEPPDDEDNNDDKDPELAKYPDEHQGMAKYP